mgnify:CR=1 FL=1
MRCSTHIFVLLLLFCTHPAHADTEATTPDDVRRIVADALADAATRTSLLNAEAGLGSNGRFFLASSDGNFRLSPSAEVQFRYRATFDADDDNHGFQMQRLRLNFRGHAITPALRYRLHLRYRPNTGDFAFDDIYAEYTFDSGISLRLGQFKLPFDRENYATSSTLTLLPDRSLLDTVFALSRAPGAAIHYDAERWRLAAAISNGRRAAGTDFSDPDIADIAITGRFEYRFAEAPWSQFDDQTAFPGDDFGILLGLGAHWQQGDATNSIPGSDGFTNLLAYTADIGIENDGWNLLAVFTGQTIESNGPSFTDLGFMIQGGRFIHDQAELFARYAHIFPDSDRTGGSDPFAAVTAGFNWYFIPHSQIIKLTAEITYFPDTQADSDSLIGAPNTGSGLLPDDSAGQFALGFQLQFMF